MVLPELEDSPNHRVEIEFHFSEGERIAWGKVVDQHGASVDKVHVLKMPILSLPADSQSSASFSFVAKARPATETNAQGEFQIKGLHPTQAYKFVFFHPQFGSALGWMDVGFPGERYNLGSIALVPGGKVWGKLLDPQGNPIPAKRIDTVALYKKSADNPPAPGLPKVGIHRLAAFSQEDGSFLFQPFPPGDFYLTVDEELNGPYHMEAGGEVGPLQLSWSPPNPPSLIHLRVVGSDGNTIPMAYAQLIQLKEGSDSKQPRTPTSWTSSTGDSSGNLFLRAKFSGHTLLRVRDFGGNYLEQEKFLEVSEEKMDLTITLDPNPNPAGSLHGTIVSASGTVLENLRVQLIPNTGSLSCNCFQLTVTTDAAGYFSFGSVYQAKHRLLISDPNKQFPPTTYYPAEPGNPLWIVLQ